MLRNAPVIPVIYIPVHISNNVSSLPWGYSSHFEGTFPPWNHSAICRQSQNIAHVRCPIYAPVAIHRQYLASENSRSVAHEVNGCGVAIQKEKGSIRLN